MFRVGAVRTRTAAAMIRGGILSGTLLWNVHVAYAQAPANLPQAPPSPAQAPAAPAQTPAIPRVEFDDAITRALEHNLTVAQALTSITHAELLVQQSRAVNLPTVTALYGNSTLNYSVALNGLVIQPRNQSTISGSVALSILNLSQWAAVQHARDQVDVAQVSTADVRRSVAAATADAYLAVIAARRQVDVDERALENARAHLDYAQRRVQGGVGSRLNEVRAAQAASQNETHLEATQLALIRAQEGLGVLLAADTPIDAGADPAFDVPSTIDEREWMQARTDVQVQQATLKATERVVNDSWRDWVGTATASFVPQLVAPAGLFQPSKTWRFAISFAQPIYEGGLRRIDLKLRELQVDQTRIALNDVEVRARSEVRSAQESIERLTRGLDSARTSATQAAEVLTITNSAFEVGASTNIEVIDAQSAARDADSAAAIAEDALRRARLDLLVALGRFPK
jgi:outer membrane protein TolC